MSSEQKTTTSDTAPVFQINQKKLKELAENSNAVKIGGKVSSFLFEKKNKFVY